MSFPVLSDQFLVFLSASECKGSFEKTLYMPVEQNCSAI